jgi:segregation and condensation protein A
MILQSTPYQIQLPVYEGPLDLLLDLIERAELDITKVSLARVTDQYLAYLQTISEHELEDLASFLVIAARLLQIKSEALLPRPPLREPGEEDPGDALARQLMAYKKYKQVAVLLAERERDGLRTYVRLAAPPAMETRPDLSELTLEDLREAMIEAITNMPQKPSFEREVIAPRIRIRDKISAIIQGLRSKGTVSFHRMIEGAKSRLEVVVSLLALLELIKREQVNAEQEALFSDVTITPGKEWADDQDLEFDLEFEE